jgi:hypothetical protein
MLKFRLLNQTRWIHCVRFGRVNEIEGKDVFVCAGADVKTIPVIRRIQNEATILKDNPITASTEIDDRDANKHNDDRRAADESERKQRPGNQTGTSNWLIILNIS